MCYKSKKVLQAWVLQYSMSGNKHSGILRKKSKGRDQQLQHIKKQTNVKIGALLQKVRARKHSLKNENQNQEEKIFNKWYKKDNWLVIWDF